MAEAAAAEVEAADINGVDIIWADWVAAAVVLPPGRFSSFSWL